MTSENRFFSSFDSFACVGDTIQAEIDGFAIVARLEFDEDARPEHHGFDPNDSDHAERNRKICDSWKRDEWFYGAIVLSVSRRGIELDRYAASLGAIDVNFPGSDNENLTDVANELLDEALESAKATLKDLCSELCSA